VTSNSFKKNLFWLGVQRELLSILGSLPLAITLFLVIALCSTIGTVLPQQEGTQFYQEKYPDQGKVLFGFLTWKVILGLGLNDVYRTWWFLALLILFGTSLATCSFLRQIPMLKSSRKWRFYDNPKRLKKFALFTEVPATLEQLIGELKQKGFQVQTEGQKIYAHKGLLGRVGPIIVHLSIILILLGGMWGALTGFKTQSMTPEGEQFDFHQLTSPGPWTEAPKWQVKVNRFWIDYRPDGSIKQFYSDLSVIDTDGKEKARKTISVNDPMTYDGVSMYQASWGVDSVLFRVNNTPWVKIPMRPLEQVINGKETWGAIIPLDKEDKARMVLATNGLQGTVQAILFGGEKPIPISLKPGVPAELTPSLRLEVKGVTGATGVQSKKDPGTVLVYTGFGLLMIGVMMSYLSHSQVWAFAKDGVVYVAGRTNRAQITFEREFMSIVSNLQNKRPSPSDVIMAGPSTVSKETLR
jgi:cytochrome c biogenesis protein